MSDLHLTLAISDYDHVHDLTSGRVKPQGIELTHLNLAVEEIFFRFAKSFEWDVSELSFAKYCSFQAEDDPPVVGIPVFPSRVFRHSCFYMRRDGKVAKPEDIRGKRMGIPEWSQTATVYARGMLVHQYGIPLGEIDWVQSGVDEPGRAEMAHLNLPADIRYRRVADRSLTEMLLDGDIDILMSARPPTAFLRGDDRIVRLFPDFRRVEEAYFRDTGIFPIMHTIAVRRDVYEANRWVLMNLMTAFEEAKRRSVERLTQITTSSIALPWIYDTTTEIGRLIFPGGQYWPYGIEPNRTTIDAFLQYSHEQGLCRRRLRPEELYPEEVQSIFKV